MEALLFRDIQLDRSPLSASGITHTSDTYRIGLSIFKCVSNK